MTNKIVEKQTAPSLKIPNKWLPLISFLAAVVIFAAAFGAACAVATSRATIFPGITVASIPVGGLTEEQAEVAVKDAFIQRYAGREMILSFPDIDYRQTLPLDDIGNSVDVRSAVHSAYLYGRENGPINSGLTLVTSLFHKENIEPAFSLADDSYLRTFLADVSSHIDNPVVEHHYEIQGDQLVFTVGHTGHGLDREEILSSILDRLAVEDYSELACNVITTEPADLDWDAVYNEIYVEAADAKLDESTYEIKEHIVGVRFDKEAAMEAFSQASPDETVSVPLIYTEPDFTTDDLAATLFHDVIGSCTTTVGGSNNRANNVKLAASLVNGTILNPGETFSYNGVVGSRQASRGFLPAPAYVGGQTVNEIGGGICQLSSTIYLASMRANLKIVERHNHTYAVGYVPDGMDATVYYGSLDFQFQNDTDRPIKIACAMEGRTLTVNIYGTKQNDYTVKITNKVLGTTPYKTVYQEDSHVTSQKVKTTGYSGKKVETYRSIYDTNGNLISSKVEAVSQYKTRNKVILVPAKSNSTAAPASSSSVTVKATAVPTATLAPA